MLLILEHLMAEGFLAPAEITSSDFVVRDRSGRNRLTLVETADRAISVKVFNEAGSYRRETVALRSLSRCPQHFVVPSLIGLEANSVITQTDPGLVTLHEWWHRGVGRRGVRQLARALAELHAWTTTGLARARPGVDPSGAGPGILDSGPGFRAVVRLLQAPAVHDALAALDARLGTGPQVFSHGDVRAANVLFGKRGICLIDWETAGTDSRWRDVGAVLAMLIEDAIERGAGPPASEVVINLLREYGARAGLVADVDAVVQVAGARLLQFAAERGRSEWPVGEHSRAITSAGRFFLLHPREAARRLRLQV